MSQLTFDGFTEPPFAKATGDKSSVALAKEGWYKGRVLSHSSMNTYRDCPQKWKFRYIDKIPEKPRSFFSFGKSVHAGLEFLFEKIKEPLPSLDALLDHYKAQWLSEGYETAEQERWFYKEGERILRGFYAKQEKGVPNVFQVEFKFTIPIDGVPVTGFIDRVDQTPSGRLAIVDYKTGKAFDKSRVRTDPQLTLYQIACQDVFGKPVESVTLYHLNSLTPLTVPAHSKTMEQNLRTAVVEVAKGISDNKFDPKPDERGACQWCDYVQVCPAFAGKKSVFTRNGAASDMAEKVDRLGKLDERLLSLQAERAELADEISAYMNGNKKDQLDGRHFSASRESGENGAPPAVRTAAREGTPVA